jgi:hypothetical protein
LFFFGERTRVLNLRRLALFLFAVLDLRLWILGFFAHYCATFPFFALRLWPPVAAVVVGTRLALRVSNYMPRVQVM